MKKQLTSLTLAILAISTLLCGAQSDIKGDPAYLPIDELIDLKKITPEVNVNLPKFLLLDAASGLEMGEDDPFAAAGTSLKELIQGIKLVRVVVIEADEAQKAELDRGTAKLRKQLEDKWVTLVSLPDENIGIYALSDESGESMAGLALLINDGGDVIIANVVGKISLGKVMRVATQIIGGENGSLNIGQLLEQVLGATGRVADESKSDDDSNKEGNQES